MASRLPLRQFASFAGVGAIGFVIDAVLFLLATSVAAWPVPYARALSALCSLSATWTLNRSTTFANQTSRHASTEYFRYVLAQLVGLGINLSVFAACLAFVPQLRNKPFIALLIGAGVALIVNFLTARKYAFRADD